MFPICRVFFVVSIVVLWLVLADTRLAIELSTQSIADDLYIMFCWECFGGVMGGILGHVWGYLGSVWGVFGEVFGR